MMSKKTIISVFSAAIFGFSPLGLVTADSQEDGILRIGGSTTLLPIITNAASDFMERYNTWEESSSDLPNKDVVIFVSGGGSGFGVKSTITGIVDIGLASRDLKDKEKTLLGDHTTILVGWDAVAIAANSENAISKLKKGFTKLEVAEILSGEKRTMQDVIHSLPPDEIVLLVRDSGAGSAEVIQKLIMIERQISPDALQLPSQGALLRKLETNTRAVGYISSGLVLGSDKLHAFELDGIIPSNENVINGKYLLVRPLLMVVDGKPDPIARRFIDYILNEGQEIVKLNNYVPSGGKQ